MPEAIEERRKRLHNIHDFTFIQFAKDGGCAVPLAKFSFGEERAREFDWDDVRFEDTKKVGLASSIEKRYDLLLSVNLRVEDSLRRILLLLEHKSYHDSDLMKQLLGYLFVHYESSDVPMVPIVLYHGQTKLVDLQSFQDSLDYGDEKFKSALKRLFGGELLQFRALFVNFRDLAKVAHLLDPGWDCMAHMMANIRDFNRDHMRPLVEKTTRIVDFGRRYHITMLSLLYIEFIHPEKFDVKDFAALEREIEPDPDKRVLADVESMNEIETRFGRHLYDHGIEFGREQGIEQTVKDTVFRMSAHGFDLDDICVATDLSRDEVEKLRSQRSG